jgi:hypothetical protein
LVRGGLATPSADRDIDAAFKRLERGEIPQDAALLDDLMLHEQRREALDQLRRILNNPRISGRPGRTPDGVPVNPNPGQQSAHTTPQAALRDLPQYDPNEMITRFLSTGRGHAHTVFDQFWQRECAALRATGRTTMTAQELHDMIGRAARQSGAFSPEVGESVAQLATNDLFIQLGMSPNQLLRIPGS